MENFSFFAVSATRVKNFDFDNETSENIFSQPYFSHMANQTLQREQEFHSKNYLPEMPHSHVNMRLKSPPQKLDFVMSKAISKSYTQGYSIVIHRNAASFLIKTVLCETNNILFSRGY